MTISIGELTMANRPIFCPNKEHIVISDIEFKWHPGLSKQQKQRSVDSLHQTAKDLHGLSRILEVSTKSQNSLGVKLSAFNLKMTLNGRGVYSIESIYQGSKIFSHGGPFTDLYSASSMDAKKDSRLKSSGNFEHYLFEGEKWDRDPARAFYNWIYITALKEMNEKSNILENLSDFDGFSDIEFNPKKSINCQAHALAFYLHLIESSCLEEALNDKKIFCEKIIESDPNYQHTF